MDILPKPTEFNWNKGNHNKNWVKHKVSYVECEEVFFNTPLVVSPDKAHSKGEGRYYLLGRTNNNRLLFLVFTVRNDKIRTISARDMKRKERIYYYETEKGYS